MIRALTKTKAPMQLPTTVLTGIDFPEETASAACDCVAEEEETVWMIVRMGALGVGPAATPESIDKPVAVTAVLVATATPEMSEAEGRAIGSDLLARYRPSWINMDEMKVWKRRSGLERLGGGNKGGCVI